MTVLIWQAILCVIAAVLITHWAQGELDAWRERKGKR